MKPFRRIPFGQETRMTQLSTTCTGCGVPLGTLHLPGCEAEECPSCGLALVYCQCRGQLSPGDEFIYLTVLAADLGDRMQVGEVYGPRHDSNRPPLSESATLLSLMTARPDFFGSHISPAGWNGAGKPEFSTEDLQRVLTLEGAEVEFIRNLQLERQISPSNHWC